MSMRAAYALGVAQETAGFGVRVVSLVAGVIELLFALGLDRLIVARTGFAVRPRGKVCPVRKIGGTSVLHSWRSV
jgi:ABC-type hemin transport system substrate-binding protein